MFLQWGFVKSVSSVQVTHKPTQFVHSSVILVFFHCDTIIAFIYILNNCIFFNLLGKVVIFCHFHLFVYFLY